MSTHHTEQPPRRIARLRPDADEGQPDGAAAEVVLAAWKPKLMPEGEVLISTAGGVFELVTAKSSTVQRLADEVVELYTIAT